MNETGLMQPWLDKSQSREKNILSHYCNNKVVDNTKHQNLYNINTQYRNNKATKIKKTKQNSKYIIDAFNRLPSNSITISPRQIQEDQQKIQEFPSQKMEKP
jgi:hypothetical protein